MFQEATVTTPTRRNIIQLLAPKAVAFTSTRIKVWKTFL